MKGTIIGTDLLEYNNSVKILETNTNTCIFNEGADLLEYDTLFNTLVSNSITEFHYIWTEVDSHKPGNQPYRFKTILEQKCSENNISFTDYVVSVGSITVPYIEDASHKFILRQAFDTTALVDDTYCADKFEFFSLMSGSSYIPNTYQNDEILGIDTVNGITDNGDNPNILIKARYPNYDYSKLPELHILTSVDELTELKAETPTNHLLQEFIFDEANLVDGRYSIIRSIDIIYGGNLDVVNMGGYRQSTIIPLTFTSTELLADTTKLNQKSRYKYITKDVSKEKGIEYHTDDESMILDYTGSLIDVDTIKLGDYVKSINFEDAGGYNAAKFTANVMTYNWDSTVQLSNETLTQMSSSLQSMVSSSVDTIYVRVTLEDGKTWVDSPSCTYYIEESGSLATRFEKLNKMYVGDKLVVTDSNTNLLTTIAISGLEMEHAQKVIYSMDFEPSDLFLVDIGDGDFSIMHNSCWCPSQYCGNYCNSYYCPACDSGPPKSDIRFKENVKLIGKSPLGINIYEFNYIGESDLYEGVIAQELINTEFESALSLSEDGKYRVDYNKIDVEFKKIN
jgi:hypothetical protein